MPRLRLLIVVAVAVLAAMTLVVAPAAAQDARQTAVVALGDSAAAGEGAGDYAAGTRGENGDWCHRSPNAYVNLTRLAPVAVNLACSGARSADVAFGGDGRYTEPSQAEQLVAVARRYRVTTVVLQVGANDDAALTDTGVTCIRALLDIIEPPCRQTLGPLVPARMAATARKVEAAVGDVQVAMRRAGYGPSAWTLVLASYASPITDRMVGVPAVAGCPYSRADAGWGRTVLFPALSEALRGVADRTGARFLDLDRAAEGFEACSRGEPGQEWQRRLTVDARALAYGGLGAIGYHLAQESFHPSAAGHVRLAGCVRDFVRSRAAAGACVAGADGRARLSLDAPAAPAA